MIVDLKRRVNERGINVTTLGLAEIDLCLYPATKALFVVYKPLLILA